MKSLVAALVAFAMALLVSACTTPASDGHTDHEHGADTSSPVSGEPAAFNDADVMFATMMIPHHEQAVELSDLVPDHTTNPDLIALAKTISGAQGPEIETMKVFLVQWNAGEAGGHDGHDMSDMQGMVDTATMDKLKTLKGNEFDTLWLQSMIAHHEGAIEMANAEVKDGANVDAKKLAQEIIDGQTAEIAQMRKMGMVTNGG
jgi:uncharacterized protein (DUF305 family)